MFALFNDDNWKNGRWGTLLRSFGGMILIYIIVSSLLSVIVVLLWWWFVKKQRDKFLNEDIRPDGFGVPPPPSTGVIVTTNPSFDTNQEVGTPIEINQGFNQEVSANFGTQL